MDTTSEESRQIRSILESTLYRENSVIAPDDVESLVDVLVKEGFVTATTPEQDTGDCLVGAVMKERTKAIIAGLLDMHLRHTDLENVYNEYTKETFPLSVVLETFPFIDGDLRKAIVNRMPKEKDLRCDNCRKAFAEEDLEHAFPNIPNLTERIEPGSIVPAGECPECGALVYDMDEMPDNN